MPGALVFVFAVGIKLRGVGAAESGATFADTILADTIFADTSSFRESGRFWSEPRSFVSGGYARAARPGERCREEESSQLGATALG
jgi:hypothetical protein